MQKYSCVFCPLFCYDIRWSGSFVLQINSRTREKFPGSILNFQVLTENTEWGSTRKTVFMFYKCVLVICPMEQFGGSARLQNQVQCSDPVRPPKRWKLWVKRPQGAFLSVKYVIYCVAFSKILFLILLSTKLRPCLTEMLDNIGVCQSQQFGVPPPPYMSPHNMSWKSSSLNSF